MPAFLPVTIFPGYLAGYILDLHGFRSRSLVERLFWSLPLSIGISAIAVFLIGKTFSLELAVAIFSLLAVAAAALIASEELPRRRSRRKLLLGCRPLGATAFLLVLAWIALVILSLVDLQRNDQLFLSVPVADQAFRVNWTQSILRTGIPPANSLYLYGHPALMRNYYFWYALCALVARGAHLPVRAVLNAGSVWAGFTMASIAGLFLKYFLAAGQRLRRQFLITIGLFFVTGLDILAILWNVFVLHLPPSPDLEWWSQDPVISWFDTLLWAPHHAVALACCLFAFLLAWLSPGQTSAQRASCILIAGASMASAFGLSIYVTFAFFLLMLAWSLWQLTGHRNFKAPLFLAVSGTFAAFLLVPYLLDLFHTSSGMQGGSAFGVGVRQMIPPQAILSLPALHAFAAAHPGFAANVAKLVLLPPGYLIELGFFLLVLPFYAMPSWRGNSPVTPAQRTLLFLAIATLVLTSFLRSWVLTLNDFGFRSALFLQFALLLLASDLFAARRLAPASRSSSPAPSPASGSPAWVRSLASLALTIGVLSTVYQVLMLRFTLPLAEWAHDRDALSLSRNAGSSASGYARMNLEIPPDATVQFNPSPPSAFWSYPDLLGVNHQVAMITARGLCGSELGGDPAGCPLMAAEIPALFRVASAQQARTVCSRYQIRYLVARTYDPAWSDQQGWVWQLAPVVADPEFRVLDCGTPHPDSSHQVAHSTSTAALRATP